MNRRDLLATTTAGLGLLVASTALAEPADKKAPVPALKPVVPKADPRAALLAALAECVRTGDACIGHCARELATGEKDMAHCNVAAQAMVAVTTALARVASLDAPAAKKLATLCAEVCKECAAACAEHKAHFAHGMHLECKACLEACEVCQKACADFAKA
jgi:Cys-rich four helix bundle protein (predicted Tat secretion target)